MGIQDDVPCAVAKGLLERVKDWSALIGREALVGNGGAGLRRVGSNPHTASIECRTDKSFVSMASRHRTISAVTEGIYVARARQQDVLRVSSYYNKVSFKRRGSDQSINVRNWIRNSEVSPSLGNGAIHANDAIPEFTHRSIQPFVKCHGRRRISPADPLHTVPQFTNRQDAQK